MATKVPAPAMKPAPPPGAKTAPQPSTIGGAHGKAGKSAGKSKVRLPQ